MSQLLLLYVYMFCYYLKVHTESQPVHNPRPLFRTLSLSLSLSLSLLDWFTYENLGVKLQTPDGREFPFDSAYQNLLDNLVGAEDETRSLPPFVYMAVGLAGPGSQAAFGAPLNCGNGPGTPRSIELVTVSDAYAKFIAYEVLPWVANHPDIKAKYPNFRFTDDPLGRVVLGQSNGGSNAFKMVFFRYVTMHYVMLFSLLGRLEMLIMFALFRFHMCIFGLSSRTLLLCTRPDLFGTAVGHSAGLVQQGEPLSSDEEYPLNNAELWVPPPDGQGLIAAKPLEKGRYYINVNENDVGTKNGC